MAIKGIAQEVVSALDFDPFEALNNEGGGQGEQDSQRGQRESAGQRPRDGADDSPLKPRQSKGQRRRLRKGTKGQKLGE